MYSSRCILRRATGESEDYEDWPGRGGIGEENKVPAGPILVSCLTRGSLRQVPFCVEEGSSLGKDGAEPFAGRKQAQAECPASAFASTNLSRDRCSECELVTHWSCFQVVPTKMDFVFHPILKDGKLIGVVGNGQPQSNGAAAVERAAAYRSTLQDSSHLLIRLGVHKNSLKS